MPLMDFTTVLNRPAHNQPSPVNDNSAPCFGGARSDLDALVAILAECGDLSSRMKRLPEKSDLPGMIRDENAEWLDAASQNLKEMMTISTRVAELRGRALGIAGKEPVRTGRSGRAILEPFMPKTGAFRLHAVPGTL